MVEAVRAPSDMKRRLWLALGLLVVLPAAFAVNIEPEFRNWWLNSELRSETISNGSVGVLGGAQWRIVTAGQVKGRAADTSAVLIELEAKVLDPVRFHGLPCRIALNDGEGREWLPTLLLPQELRAIRAGKPDQKSCNSTVNGNAQAGETLTVTESFILPRTAVSKAMLTLSLPADRPRYLKFLLHS